MKDQRVIYVKETTFGSVVSDIVTFGTLCGSFWFNYRFIDGNNWFDALLFVSFFLFALGKAGNYKRLKALEKEK